MIRRKNGETNKEWASRCQAYAEQLEENNRALRVMNTTLAQEGELVNPRTMKKYEKEAQQMFVTIALIEEALRREDVVFAKTMAQSQLHELQFDDTDIYTNACLKDGAYRGEKKG